MHVLLPIRLGSAKIDYLYLVLVFWVDHDVLRFDVSMTNILLVAVLNCREELLHDMSSRCLIESTWGGDLIKQLHALEKFCDEVNASVVFVNFVQLHYVWIVQILEDVDLKLKSDPLLGSHLQFVNLFYHKNLPIRFLLALDNFAKSTFSKYFLVHYIVFVKVFYILELFNEVCRRTVDLL